MSWMRAELSGIIFKWNIIGNAYAHICEREGVRVDWMSWCWMDRNYGGQHSLLMRGRSHYCYGSCNLFLIKVAKKRREERKILCYDCHVERGELSELTGKLWNGFMLLMDVNVLDFVAAHIVIRKKLKFRFTAS